jgi:hypothetical protein
MTVSNKTGVIAAFGFGVATIFAALALSANDVRERTVRLERFAQQIERAQRLDPATERYARDLIAAVRAAQAANEDLWRRQLAAIGRIETVLGSQRPAAGDIDEPVLPVK